MPSENINDGEIGLSSILRDMMRISEMDKVELKLPLIKEKNPLNAVELQIEVLHVDDKYLYTDKINP